MLSKKVENILNVQVEKEAYSSHLYLAMASWAEINGLPGIASWLHAQSLEERNHMLKFIEYINERAGEAVIPALKMPPSKYDNIKALFKSVLEHEQFISKSINEIVALCTEERDYTTLNWVQWFVNEQIEEEKSARVILDKLNLIGDGSFYYFDKEIISLRS